MGCGILFPRDYRADVDSGGSAPSSPEEMDDLIDVEDYVDTDSDDGEIWDKQTSETNIQVSWQALFFFLNTTLQSKSWLSSIIVSLLEKQIKAIH